MKHLIISTLAAVLLSIICTAPIVALPPPATFYGAQNFGTDRGGPYAIEGGDFDGDGRADAVGGYISGITVQFGDGTGGFVRPYVLLYEPSLGGDFYFPYTGDVNGDGLSDIVVRRRNLSNVWSLAVYLGKADRTFSAPIFSNFSHVAAYLQIVDVDNDGKLDVVGGGASYDIGNFIAVYKGDGSGVFVEEAQFTRGNSDSFPIVADFNADNLPDILFAVGDVDKIALNSGGGQFAAPVVINNGLPIHPVGTGDFNGDGFRDLVAVNGTFSPWNEIWLGTGNLNFSLANEIQIPSHDRVILWAVTDLNGDGKADLIFNSLNRILIRAGVGDGTFSNPIIYGEGGNAGLFVRDTNGDGLPDIVTAQPVEWGVSGSASISVMINQGGMSFRSAPVFATGNGTTDIATADFDGNGLTDMVIANSDGGSSPGNTLVLYQSTSAGFSEPAAPDPVKTAAVVGINPYGVRVGDLNRDGKPDIVVYGAPIGGTQNLLIFLNQGGRVFSSSFSQIGTGTLYGISLADINGDGKLDIVATAPDGISTLLGSGTGTFGSATQYLAGISNWSVATGDINGDGAPDIVAVSNLINKIAVLLNNGNGAFTNTANIAVNGVPSAVALGKMNGDGLNDIVLAKGTGVSVMISNGDGTFGTEMVYAITPVSAKRVTLADLNGDGKTDVATAAGSNVASVLINNGFGGLGQETVWSAGVTLAAITTADIDGDQRADLLAGYTASQEGYLKILFNTTAPPTSVSRAFCDFDGDGKTDISIFRPNGATGSEWWYLKSSNGGNFATQFGSPTDKLVAADYTGDGKADIAFWRPSTGEWFILRSEDSSFYAFPFGASGDIPAPADFDGDGKADAAVFRPSSATWFIQNSGGGTTIQAFGAADDVPVVGDYDGDGKADLAIFRPNGATSSEWWILRSTAGLIATQFGTPTDKTVPGDYTGDGKTDIAIWRPSNGQWYILRSEDFSFYAFPFGASTDIPTPGDYDGDGKTDAAVFRPSSSTWFAQGSASGTIIQQFGSTGDIPVPSEFVR